MAYGKEESLLSVMQAENRAEEFISEFTELKNGNYEYKRGLTADNILEKAGFREVKFTDLDQVLQDGIKNTGSKNWHGYPFDHDNKQSQGIKIFADKGNSTFYCVNKLSENSYSWSRIEKTEDVYKITPIDNDSNIGDVIEDVVFFEIQYRLSPENNPRYTGGDIIIPSGEITIAGETRDQAKEVIGLA